MKRYAAVSLILLMPLWAAAQSAPVQGHPPAAAVASAHALATRAGIDVIKQGGNAFDAAVAVSLEVSGAELRFDGSLTMMTAMRTPTKETTPKMAKPRRN